MGDFIYDLILFIVIVLHIFLLKVCVLISLVDLYRDTVFGRIRSLAFSLPMYVLDVSTILPQEEEEQDPEEKPSSPKNSFTSEENKVQDARFTFINKEQYENMLCVKLYKKSPQWVRPPYSSHLPSYKTISWRPFLMSMSGKYEILFLLMVQYGKNHPHKFGHSNYLYDLSLPCDLQMGTYYSIDYSHLCYSSLQCHDQEGSIVNLLVL